MGSSSRPRLDHFFLSRSRLLLLDRCLSRRLSSRSLDRDLFLLLSRAVKSRKHCLQTNFNFLMFSQSHAMTSGCEVLDKLYQEDIRSVIVSIGVYINAREARLLSSISLGEGFLR